MDNDVLFSREVGIHPRTGNKLMVVVSLFNEVEYLSIREYYQDFDGEWYPAKEGITHELSLSLVSNLKTAFEDLLTS